MAIAKRVLGLLVAASLGAASTANAQSAGPSTEKFFLNVNIGEQSSSQIFHTSATLPVYAETAILTTDQAVNGGPVFDFGGGYRVWGDFFAGVTVSWFHDSGTSIATTQVPDPLFFNRPTSVTTTVDGLTHAETTVAPHVVWVTPLTDKFDLAFSGGLSFIHLSQQLVNSFAVAPGTQNVTLNTDEESGSGVGGYAAVDLNYNIAPRWAIGGYARYSGAKVDLDSAKEVSVGGVQAGGGIRLRF